MPTSPEQATILIVEDNADNLFIALELLRTKVKVRYCNGRASGRQMLKLIETLPGHKVDLILLDIQIPFEDGYTILEQIKQSPNLCDTIVVAFTANIMPEDIERARQAGFHGFIGKPISKASFPELIKRILRGESVWTPRL